MKVLKEHFPYRFVEMSTDLRIEKYDPVAKKYRNMYTCGCELQMLTAMEDVEYAKWLDPDDVPCYRSNRGDTITAPYYKKVNQ